MEVIYLGLRQTPDMIVASALQEDVDVIALSSLNNAYDNFPSSLKSNEKKGLRDVLLVGGGIILKKILRNWKAWAWESYLVLVPLYRL